MIGDALRAFRKRLGLTQAELAEQLGVARNSVARWEMGIMAMRESAVRLLLTLKPKARPKRRRHAER